MSIQIAYDCIHANIGRAPKGLLAGYTTGTDGSRGTPAIRWTADDWKAHPDAVRIDQDPAASDDTADVLDVEAGAATLADVPGWSRRALAAYRSGKRPGQRTPLIYCSQSVVTPVANVLTGAGLADGSIGLFIANWNLTQAQAAAEVLAASGPFPVHGIQFRNAGDFDIDVFSTAWLNARSGQHPRPAETVVQMEYYKDGFGWVLPDGGTLHVPATGKVRVRTGRAAVTGGTVAVPGTWSPWQQFTAPK